MNPVEVDGEDSSAVVGEESSEGSTDDFTSIHDGDGLAERAGAVREQDVVHLAVLERLDDGEGCAGENRFDEGAVLVGDGSGRVEGGGGREGELARIDEASVVVEREEPAARNEERNLVAKERRGSPGEVESFDVLERRDRLLEVRVWRSRGA